MCLETSDHSNVYHPHQRQKLDTVFRFNHDLNRAEYFNWATAAWDSIGDVWTTAPATKPRHQWRELIRRNFTTTTYGKTYLEPFVEG